MSPVPDRPSPARSRAASGAAATGPPVSDDRITGALDTNLAQTAVEVVVPERAPGAPRHLLGLVRDPSWHRGAAARGAPPLRRAGRRRSPTSTGGRPATSSYYNRHERGPEALVGLLRHLREGRRGGDGAHGARRMRSVSGSSTSKSSRPAPASGGTGTSRCSGRPWPAHGPERRGVARAGRGRLVAPPAVGGAPSQASPRGPPTGPALDDALGLLERDPAGGLPHAGSSREDPVTWYREVTSDPGTPTRCPSPSCGSHTPGCATTCANSPSSRAAGAAGARARASCRFRTTAEIVQAYLDAAQAIAPDADSPSGLLPRIHWLLRLLEQDGLEAVSEPALRELNSLCSRLMTQERGRAAGRPSSASCSRSCGAPTCPARSGRDRAGRERRRADGGQR